jgi:phosphate-selective porin OprO/OprP
VFQVIAALVLDMVSPLVSAASFADDIPARESQADLERRVRELEETVRLLKSALESRKTNDHFESPEVRPAARMHDAETRDQMVADRVAASPLAGALWESTPILVPSSTASAPVKEGGSPLTAGWKDSFILQSPDKSFLLRLTGQIQADYRNFLDSDDTTDIDSFFVRRARLGIETTMLNYYEFRLLPDFGQGQVRIQDAYLNVHYCDWLQIEMGKFKQPFSYEQLIQDRFVPTIERSLIDQVVPARDVGFMLHGQKLFDDHFDWAIAVSNGEINGDADTNPHKDLAARVAWRPFNDPDACCWIRGLQLGISGSTGNEAEAIIPASLRTPATVRWFQYNSTVRADGNRERWSPEVAYFNGPFGFAAQYLHEDQEMRPSLAGPGANVLVDLPTDAFYVMATYLLTGEERTGYSQAIEPLAPFDPHCPFVASGALELVGRVSRLRVGDEVFASGAARLADPARFSHGVTELTIGLNWYLNRWLRAQCNWEHVWFDDPVQLGSGAGGLLDSQDTLMTRFQVIF